MSCKCGNFPGILKLLQELKTDLGEVKVKCSRIEKKLQGIESKANNPGNSLLLSPLGSTALKKIVEKLLVSEIQTLQGPDVEAEFPRSNGQEVAEDVGNFEEEEYAVGKDIIVTTREEETRLTQEELEVIKSGTSLAAGETMDGSTAEEILEFMDSPRVLVIQISNYLSDSLEDAQIWLYPEDETVMDDPAPTTISACHAEVIKMQRDEYYIRGMLSFAIGTTNLRLLIFFVTGWAYLRALITPNVVPLDMKTWSSMRDNCFTTDKFGENLALCKQDGKGGDLYLKYGDIRARVRLNQRAPKVIMMVEIGSVEQVQDICTRLELVPNGLTEAAGQKICFKERPPPTEPGTGQEEECINRCIVRLGNALAVHLEDPQIFVNKGTHDKVPRAVNPFTGELITFHSEDPFQGIISYRVATTDLRLVIGLRVRVKEGNDFALAFFPVRAIVDRNLLEELFEKSKLVSRADHKMSNATDDGALKIVRRNIIVEAKMTKEKMAVLEATVATF